MFVNAAKHCHNPDFDTAMLKAYSRRSVSPTWSYTGIPCQRWDAQTPHEVWAGYILGLPDISYNRAANHCRNPDGDSGGVWCVTTNPFVEWEHCYVPHCSHDPSQPGIYYNRRKSSVCMYVCMYGCMDVRELFLDHWYD